MEKLETESINKLLESLSSSGFMPNIAPGRSGVTAEFFDNVVLALGCSNNLMINRNHSPSDGLSPAVGALMYQNLLLAKRVAEIEGLFKNVHTLSFSSIDEQRIFTEKYIEPKL